MKKDPFQYIFRFCCDPGFNDAEEIPALLRYVDEADIDDVAVFANVEEINTGHMSFDEQDVYLAMMRKISALLAEKGVTMSVNQCHARGPWQNAAAGAELSPHGGCGGK